MTTLVKDNPSVRAGNMAPFTLDLFLLTFNCAKNFINVAVFASHLQSAFKQNATALPDVVVFSLQEVAPLSYSFIGGYFLSPYLARFEEALNLAATRFSADDTITIEQTSSANGASNPVRPYTLVRARNVGMTAIMLFARDPAALQNVTEAEVGFGAAEMGNKGAVGLRFSYEGTNTQSSTELTFVATHLAAMEWNLPKRNANWAAIMRGMAFENPETVLDPKTTALREAQEAGSSGDEERERLLHDEHHARDRALQSQLQDISVFKPSSHLFVAGDLNYRISSRSPPPQADFPSLDPNSEHHYSTFFPLDQLTRERKAGRTLHGMSEAEVRFPPTYKYDVLPPAAAVAAPETEEVPWSFASHRYPSWTDRVLFLDVPTWVCQRVAPEKQKIDVKAYDAMPVVRSSDHRAVFFRAEVPLLSAEEMKPSGSEEAGLQRSDMIDPRITMPVAIDPEAWERRAAARRREVFAGWSMYLWSTKQGALVIATALAVGVGGWWLVRGL